MANENDVPTPLSDGEPSASQSTVFPVSVIVERQNVEGQRWVTERWQSCGVLAGEHVAEKGVRGQQIRADDDGEQYLWTGFTLELFKDEAESYYSNLRGERPSVFVICREGEEDEEEAAGLAPFLVTLSYDEAASYMEADDDVFSLPIPPEIYLWVERYVVENYVPREKKKRKRVAWAQSVNRG